MKHFFALAFSTPLAPARMYARLRENKRWRWIDRDGDRWGEYLSSTDVPGVPGARVSVYSDEPEPGRCALNVLFHPDATNAEDRCDALREILLSKLLPSIEAYSIAEIDFLE